MNETLKFKKLGVVTQDKDGNPITLESKAVLPTRAHSTDAGYDLTATRITQELDEARKLVLVYHTDLAVEIPEGYVGLIFMRSSVSKTSLTLANAVAVIDSGYRGELILKYKVTTDALPRVYEPGERVGQLVIVPYFAAEPEFVDQLSSTDRGDGGFGSTDKTTDLTLNTDEHNEGESGDTDRRVQEDTSKVSE